MLRLRFVILTCMAAFVACCAFLPQQQSHVPSVLHFYETGLDTVMLRLEDVHQAAQNPADIKTLLRRFLQARMAYKKVEFMVTFTDRFLAYPINGPDLMRIDDESPADTVKPHGFQVLEDILCVAPKAPDSASLRREIAVLYQEIKALRNSPDRQYQWTDARAWSAARYGIYRVISLGITGFDVPHSYHAMPETGAVLRAIRGLTMIYRRDLEAKNPGLYRRGEQLLLRAERYATQHPDFNAFDRLTFIRSYLNPVSGWLKECVIVLHLEADDGRAPLNSRAENLFAENIIDPGFFAPNERFRSTPARLVLGKKLFYDVRLSGTGTRSCASCHQPAHAFTDGLVTPVTLDGIHALPRNTPTLLNAAYQTKLFYDSRTDKLENQISAVVHNAGEMAGSLKNRAAALNDDTAYHRLFTAAYGSGREAITEYNIANAISNYVRTLTSFHSRFDQYMRRETENFTPAEKHGFNLFMGKAQCGTCHYAPLFNGLIPPFYDEIESEVIGVPASLTGKAVIDPDPGKYGYTHVPLHLHAFKTPTLRNIALTAPYMHNGVYKNLPEVIDFYNKGGGAGIGIDLPNQSLATDKLGLTPGEIKDLVIFLQSLTDTVGHGRVP